MRITSRPSLKRRCRLALLLFACGSIALAISVSWSSSAAAPPPAGPANCTPPGLTVSTDPASDQLGQEAGQNSQQDILSVSLAEEYDQVGRGTLVATMKVSALDPNALPRNGSWISYFTARHADNTTTDYFVSADTNEMGQMAFNYGHIDGNGTNITNGSADLGSVSAAGKVIIIKLALEKVKKPVPGTPFPTLTGDPVDLSAGKTVTNVHGQTTILVGSTQVGGLLQEVDVSDNGNYTFAGATACAPDPTPTPTPTPTPSGGSNAACLSPNTLLRTDATGDQTGGPAANQQLDIQSVSIAEDYRVLNDERLVFTIKVANLNTVPPNGVWNTRFTVGGTVYFVSMVADVNGAVTYEYGTIAGTSRNPAGAADFGQFGQDGTITISINRGKVGGPAAGQTITAITGQSQQFVGASGTGGFLNMDSTTPEATYTMIGKSAECAPEPPPNGVTYVKGGINFSPSMPLHAPATVRDGEPSLRVDKYGNTYVAGIRGVPAGNDLWYVDLRPTVNGQPNPTYDPLMRNPQYRGQPDAFTGEGQPSLLADGGGDVDLAVSEPVSATEDPNNPPTLTFTSLALANISTAKSTDRGLTFQKNPAGNVTGGVPVDDRQWFETVGPNTVYLLYRTFQPAVTQIQRSTDGGLTWGPARTAGSIGQVGSVDVHKATGTVYISGSSGQVCVGTPLSPLDEPVTYTCNQAAPGNANLFFVVKVADDGTPNGTAYVNYSDGRNIYIAYSTDKGATWSTPIRVNDGPEAVTNLLPWMETGPVPGSIGVVWYGTSSVANNNNTDWKVFFAQVTGANTPSPTIRQVTASDHVIHASNISLSGFNPTATNVNRNLIDYFQVAFDPMGAAVIAFTDDHNDYDGNTYVMRQISGPSIKGNDVPAPVEGAGLPARGPYSANGAQVIDPAQDARTSTTILRQNEPVDVTSITYSAEGTANNPVLVAKMKVSALSPIPPSATWRVNFAANAPDSVLSPTGQFSFGVADRGDQFYLLAQTDAAGAQTYRFGTAARNGNGGMDYTDRGAADSGSFDAATNTITMKVALSKLSPFVKAGNQPVALGTVLTGLRGSASLASAQGNSSRSDNTRGGTQYTIALPRINVALLSNGGVASALTSYNLTGFAPSTAIDGERAGVNWEHGGGWSDGTRLVWPDDLEIAFAGAKTINEIRVYTLQNEFKTPQEPTPAMTCELYGLIDFDVQYWDGSQWVTVPGGAIRGNDRVIRTINFADVTTQKIRIHVLNGRMYYSRILEVEAFGF